MTRLRRFLHLERPRAAAAGEADASPGTAERFGGVERPTAANAPGAPRSSGADLDRFGPDPEPSLELAGTAAGERPFTRCMRCGTDHHVLATACGGCGASLDTEAQREFNERLWSRRQEEAAREAAAAEERAALRERAGAEDAAARRGMAEELAREVGRRERERLRAEGLGGWSLPAAERVERAIRWLLGRLRGP